MCPDGKYLNPGSTSCINCPAGVTCPLRGKTTVAVTGWDLAGNPVGPVYYYSPVSVNIEYICPAGWECTAGTATKCSDRGVAWYSPEGDKDCYQCLSPYACPFATLGHNQRIDCRNVRGYYQDADNMLFCKVCPPGYYCPYGVADK
jgi:hypothetical protein